MKNRVLELGNVLIAPSAAYDCLTDFDSYLRRHAKGDWGDISARERSQNEQVFKGGARHTRVASEYRLPDGGILRIMTFDQETTHVQWFSPEEVGGLSPSTS